MLTIHPTPKQLDELRELRFRHPAPGAQRRAEIVLLVAHGALRRNDIAEILDVHINSVTNAVRRFMDNGVEGLLTVDNDAPDSELDAVNNLMRDQ